MCILGLTYVAYIKYAGDMNIGLVCVCTSLAAASVMWFSFLVVHKQQHVRLMSTM